MFAKCFREYCNFKTRAGLKEYWVYAITSGIIATILLCFMVILLLVLLENNVITLTMSKEEFFNAIIGSSHFMIFFVLCSASGLVCAPSWAVSVRRLHDIGKSAWWLLISFIPIIGWIWFLILMLLPGQKMKNQWGDPIEQETTQGINQLGTCGYNYKQAFKRCWDYKGKSSIEDYFGFDFVINIVGLIWFALCFIVGFVLQNVLPNTAFVWLGVYIVCFCVMAIYGIIILFPYISLQVRRLRDAGYSPWWILLIFVRCGGMIVNVMSAQPTYEKPLPPVVGEVKEEVTE